MPSYHDKDSLLDQALANQIAADALDEETASLLKVASAVQASFGEIPQPPHGLRPGRSAFLSAAAQPPQKRCRLSFLPQLSRLMGWALPLAAVAVFTVLLSAVFVRADLLQPVFPGKLMAPANAPTPTSSPTSTATKPPLVLPTNTTIVESPVPVEPVTPGPKTGPTPYGSPTIVIMPPTLQPSYPTPMPSYPTPMPPHPTPMPPHPTPMPPSLTAMPAITVTTTITPGAYGTPRPWFTGTITAGSVTPIHTPIVPRLTITPTLVISPTLSIQTPVLPPIQRPRSPFRDFLNGLGFRFPHH